MTTNGQAFESPDDVIAEIDVVLTDELKSLYLLQYPYRPRDLPPYTTDEITNIKFKPEKEELKIQLAINTRGVNYDRRMSEALATEANKGSDVPYFDSGFIDKQLLASSKPISAGNESDLAVGRFERYKDEQGNITKTVLHLTPIKNVLQMETSCDYLDTHKNSKADENVDTKPITVRFAGRESDRVKVIRQRAYSQIVKNSKEEQYLNMAFRDMGSVEADQLRMQMLCRNAVMDNTNIFNIERATYAAAITNQHATGLKCDSLKNIKDKTLADQVVYILMNSKIISFNKLLDVLGSSVDKVQALRAVQLCACLVQGNWVVKSEVLYAKDSLSDFLGLSACNMRRSRNYLLVKLNNSMELSKKQLSEMLRIPHQELDHMLTQLTKHVGPDTWRLKLERDDAFIQQNPDVVNRQKLIWDALENSLSQEFKEVRSQKIGEKITRKRQSSKSMDLG